MRATAMRELRAASPVQRRSRMKRLLVLVCSSACATAASDETELLEELLATTPDAPAPATQELVATHCPGVDHAAGVQTYKGLAGTFRRTQPAALGEPVRLTFATLRDDPDAEGTFGGTRIGANGFLQLYAGRFFAIGDNPAIGAAMALDTNGDGQIDTTHFVLGLTRAAGKITKLCLAGTTRPFLLTRSLF